MTSLEAYREKQRVLREELDAAIMRWVREHARSATVDQVDGLATTIRYIAEAHGREFFSLGKNAARIDDLAKSGDKAA